MRCVVGLRQKACCPSRRTSGEAAHLAYSVAPAAATKSAATLSRVSARTLHTARSALFNPAPAGAFSLFHISLFQKEKWGRRRQGASSTEPDGSADLCGKATQPRLIPDRGLPQFPLDIPSRVRYHRRTREIEYSLKKKKIRGEIALCERYYIA